MSLIHFAKTVSLANLNGGNMRISRDQWAIELVRVTAQRATCKRRAVGCVLTNARGHVLSTGYNGVAAGQHHCNEEVRGTFPYACKGAGLPSGTGLDCCQAIHAEQNALLQCRDVYDIDTAYVSASPCMTCAKLLMNTSCKRVVFIEEYPGSDDVKEMWTKSGRVWEQYHVE